MQDQSRALAKRLLDLIQETGYPLIQHNGQRRFGPPPDWTGLPPQRGSEVFVGKLPREIYEDELVPVFSAVGKIYEMRLMMDFSGSNRGYAFVTYTNKADASRAVKELNGYKIRPGRTIGVVKSVDNCRLFVGRIPKDKTKDDVMEALSQRVEGIVNVILYKNCFDRNMNRGFAFVEFTSHRAAAMARRALVPGCVKLWGEEITVDWAEPEPEIDDDQMKKVKVLYVRNFLIRTTPDIIQSVFEGAISGKIERLKKIYDYAFIHFYTREDAELAMQKLQNAEIDGVEVEIKWAKPVVRELYRIQKQSRGNAKFNKSFDLSQTMWLYKQHKDKREYAKSQKEDEGIGSAGSMCDSPTSVKKWVCTTPTNKDYYMLPPARLEAICNRYNWAPPVYDYVKYMDILGAEVWVGKVLLPEVSQPLLPAPRRVGPFSTSMCLSLQQANLEAAITALRALQNLQIDGHNMPLDFNHQSSQTPLQPVYSPILPALPLQMPYMGAAIGPPICSQMSPLALPPVWHGV